MILPLRPRPGFLKVLMRSTAIGCILLSTASCVSLPAKVPRTNIIMARQQGVPVDPTNGFKEFEPLKYDEYINDIFRDLAHYCQGQKQPCKVLFFFHGGLNRQKTSVDRAARLYQRIKESGSYPIFVNWNSSFPSTWWDHVAHVHKGIWTENRFVAAFPYFSLVDEVKSVAEAPVAWLAEGRHTFPRFGPDLPSIKAYVDLVHDYQGGTGIAVNDLLEGNILQDDRTKPEKFKSYATLPLTFPTKVLAPPLLIQAAGPGSWDIMQRRTAMLFRTEDEFLGIPPQQIAQERATPSPRKIGVPETGAALAHFITRFQRDFLPVFCRDGKYPSVTGGPELTSSVQEQEPKVREESTESCENRLQVTLVGHSMGTIIIDQLLRYAPNIKVRNIIFMAAATSVADYRNTVTAYLERNSETRMFHLILHPRAEVSERGFLDLSPRGSLLVWIDNYFTNPITPLDRTVGRFYNLLPELLYTDMNIRNRVNLKIFRVGASERCWNPQKHGDFGLFPFWDPNFWDPHVTSSGQAPYVRWDDKKCGSPL
jgi:hypothetical protein